MPKCCASLPERILMDKQALIKDLHAMKAGEVLCLCLTADDIAEGLDCSIERAERIIAEMELECDPVWRTVWLAIEGAARTVPEDPIVELMQEAKKANG